LIATECAPDEYPDQVYRPPLFITASQDPLAKIFESKHPYDNSINHFFDIAFDDAKCIEIVFDIKSSTEWNCDYLQFFKDASHITFWGLEKYSGLKSAERNFPGISQNSSSFC
jgi:hypothetical protein